MTRIPFLLRVLKGTLPPVSFCLLVVLLTFPSWGVSSLWAFPIILGLYTLMFTYFVWTGRQKPLPAEVRTVVTNRPKTR